MKIKATSTARFDSDVIVGRLVDKALNHRLGQAQARVQSLRCPEHGSGVSVSMEGSGATRNLIVTGCCDAFRRQAMALIRQK